MQIRLRCSKAKLKKLVGLIEAREEKIGEIIDDKLRTNNRW